jgi:hypothetical protein
MCIIIWVNKEQFDDERARIEKRREQCSRRMFSKFFPCQTSPYEYAEHPTVMNHQHGSNEINRPDSVLLPRYSSYRRTAKEPRKDDKTEIEVQEEDYILATESGLGRKSEEHS